MTMLRHRPPVAHPNLVTPDSGPKRTRSKEGINCDSTLPIDSASVGACLNDILLLAGGNFAERKKEYGNGKKTDNSSVRCIVAAFFAVMVVLLCIIACLIVNRYPGERPATGADVEGPTLESLSAQVAQLTSQLQSSDKMRQKLNKEDDAKLEKEWERIRKLRTEAAAEKRREAKKYQHATEGTEGSVDSDRVDNRAAVEDAEVEDPSSPRDESSSMGSKPNKKLRGAATPALPLFQPGDAVEHYSGTMHVWYPAKIVGMNAKNSLMYDVELLDRHQLRSIPEMQLQRYKPYKEGSDVKCDRDGHGHFFPCRIIRWYKDVGGGTGFGRYDVRVQGEIVEIPAERMHRKDYQYQ